MTIQLIDRSEEMCRQWKIQFNGCKDVIIHNGDIFSLFTDCVVSPANSFGFMDGGIDLAIRNKFGIQLETNLQKKIAERCNGELLVGQSMLINTGNKEVPYLISAPTMRVPDLLQGTANVYLASRAIFLMLKQMKINRVSICGLGIGNGKLKPEISAKQMKRPYSDFWLNNYIHPTSIFDAQKKHISLI